MTKIQDLLDDGWNVLVSEVVTVGHPYVSVAYGDHLNLNNTNTHTIAFHPLDYTYASEKDFWVAHEKNLAWIDKHLEHMADKAIEKLDLMVEAFAKKHEPKMVQFGSGVTVFENPDGTYDFHMALEAELEPQRILKRKYWNEK